MTLIPGDQKHRDGSSVRVEVGYKPLSHDVQSECIYSCEIVPWRVG